MADQPQYSIKGISIMVMWKTRSCPRCGGDIFIDVDGDILLDHCLQCSYMRPRLNASCPQCGFGMYFDSAGGKKYFYCSNCGHSIELHNVDE